MKKPFVWGVASASYQIEGGWNEGGRGLSVWDTFSHAGGNVRYDENGDVACDSYHRYEEDLDILVELGIKDYRFSIAWPRILPEGTGEVNLEGLAYYDRLVDGCIARGITPWVTIFHWDTPQALEDRYGAWQSRQIVEDFTNYALIICRHFAGRVKNYFLFNEPQCFIGLGYDQGIFAPGLKLDPEKYLHTWHNMLLAHGTALKAIRKEFDDLYIGVASTGEYFTPASESEADIAATAIQTFAINGLTWRFSASMYLDPICLGSYPDVKGSPLEAAMATIDEKELEIIHEAPDFIGLNVYHSRLIAADEKGEPKLIPFHPGYPRNFCKWSITPKVLYYGPKFYYERYGLPLCISENGCCNNDKISSDGKVHDLIRIEYMQDHLACLDRAIEEGVPVWGYFCWSILDNFEWASGYDERFGLTYVDFPTGRRIIKDSGYWYADYIRNRR